MYKMAKIIMLPTTENRIWQRPNAQGTKYWRETPENGNRVECQCGDNRINGSSLGTVHCEGCGRIHDRKDLEKLGCTMMT